MTRFLAVAILVGSLAAGAGAARAGQCYTIDGRPIGPAYEAGEADREWVSAIIARGGRCTEVGPDQAPRYPHFTEHETPNHRHLLRHQQMHRN